MKYFNKLIQTFLLLFMFGTSINAQVSGNITVGASPSDFTSIQEAINSLSGGINGNVNIIIKDGSYLESIIFPEIAGTSETSRITLKSQSGKPEKVKIMLPTGTVENTSGKIALCYVNGTDYLSIKDISFTTIGSSSDNYDAILNVHNKSENLSINNCIFESSYPSSGYSGFTLVNVYSKSSTAPETPHTNNNNFTISNSKLIGGHYGIELGGALFETQTSQEGGKIINCFFEKQKSKAIYISREKDCVISGNIITNSISDKQKFHGIDANMLSGNSKIYNNKISLETEKAAIGIELRNCYKENILTDVYNNMILHKKIKASSYGIQVSSSIKIRLAYNTIQLTDPDPTTTNISACIYSFWPSTNTSIVENNSLNIQNNILNCSINAFLFRIENHYCIVAVKSSHNILGQAQKIARIGTGNNVNEINSLADWQAKLPNIGNNSIVKQASFIDSSLDLHLTNENNEDLKIASPIAEITTDIDGYLRNETTPYAGAHELGGALPKVEISAIIMPGSAGTISGLGQYEINSEVKIKVNINEGYEFVNWTENEHIVSTNVEYTFTATSDRNLVANLKLKASEKVSIITSASPKNAGTTEGAGEYDINTEVKVKAIANDGYTFENWTENNKIVSSDVEYMFKATVNRNLIAKFKKSSDIEEYNNKNITLYPNPSDESVNIQTLETIENISILDINGKTVYSKNQIENNNIQIDLTNLKAGTYIIKIKFLANDKLFEEKIIKR